MCSTGLNSQAFAAATLSHYISHVITYTALQENFHQHYFPHFLFLVGMFNRGKEEEPGV